MKIIRYLGFTILIVLFSANTALAYIDPFTGGLLYQIATGLLASFFAAFYFFGRKIKKVLIWLKEKIPIKYNGGE